MTNEAFLQLSYVVVLLLSLLSGAVTWRLLRGSLIRLLGCGRISRYAVGSRLVVRFVLLLAPPLGFTTVSYYSCNVTTYSQVVADRDYLANVCFRQMQAALVYTIGAVFFAMLCMTLVIMVGQRHSRPRSYKGV